MFYQGDNIFLRRTFTAILICLTGMPVYGEPWLAPGDLLIRSDLQLLSDVGMLRTPINTWPLSLASIDAELNGVNILENDFVVIQALQRVQARINQESRMHTPKISNSIRVSSKPEIIRAFEDTPRAEGQIGGSISWLGERFAVKVQGRRVSNPLDNDSVHLDGSYVGVVAGNWMLSMGYQERWWGPGWDGSLILSTNARPAPQLSIQRNITRPFTSKWLKWIGPWSLTSFFQQLDDERVIDDTVLFGMRMTAKPTDDLEIGLSRTAQWCGASRPCDANTFLDLLLGHDNPGVNIDESQEPGNQLAGLDVRWTSPLGNFPYATYLQWIGEDTRQGGPQIGSWIRQFGFEFWGIIPGINWRHRSHIEWADTICREGGFGRGKKKPGCAYNHPRMYVSGYRYHGLSIGHGIDTGSSSSSIGSTLIDNNGNSVNLLARFMDINRYGEKNPLSSVAQENTQLSISYNKQFSLGTGTIGLAYSRIKDSVVDTGINSNVEWWAGFQMN